MVASKVVYEHIIQRNSGMCLTERKRKCWQKQSCYFLSNVLSIAEASAIVASYFIRLFFLIPHFKKILKTKLASLISTADCSAHCEKNKRWTHQWNLHYNIWHVRFHSVGLWFGCVSFRLVFNWIDYIYIFSLDLCTRNGVYF